MAIALVDGHPEETLALATSHGFAMQALDARIAIARAHGDSAALHTLGAEARRLGYGLLAEKAARHDEQGLQRKP
jgi:hypothetical protein